MRSSVDTVRVGVPEPNLVAGGRVQPSAFNANPYCVTSVVHHYGVNLRLFRTDFKLPLTTTRGAVMSERLCCFEDQIPSSRETEESRVWSSDNSWKWRRAPSRTSSASHSRSGEHKSKKSRHSRAQESSNARVEMKAHRGEEIKLTDVEAEGAPELENVSELPSWKALEESRWMEYENERDVRLQSLEQISLVAIFLAAFAVSDLSSFEYDKFTPPWGEIWLMLMSNVVGCTTFLSVVGTLTISTVHREAEWDRSLAEWVKRSKARSYEEAVTTLRRCPTYRLAVRQLWKLALLNTISKTKYEEKAHEGEQCLGIPFSTRTLNVMTDFNATPIGFARAMFPAAVMCYLVAIAVKILQRMESMLLIIPVCLLLTWGSLITYYSRNLLKILGHSGEGSWLNYID